MTGHELIAALQGLPSEILDLQVKFDDDGHPQTVQGSYLDECKTKPDDTHIKLVSGTMPNRFGDPLFASEWLSEMVKEDRENEAPVDFTDTTFQVNYDPDQRITVFTLVTTDSKNLAIHTGQIIYGIGNFQKVVTKSQRWRFRAVLEEIAKAFRDEKYEDRQATEQTFEEMKVVAANALRKEVEHIREIDDEKRRFEMEEYAMNLNRKMKNAKKDRDNGFSERA